MQDDNSALAVDGTERNSRTTREEWLDLAIKALIRDGIDRVKVQLIAKQLGVSRSSFYFFFKNTHDLHAQMLDLWLRKNTGPIIERAMRPSETITQSILNVFECWVDSSLFDSQLDIAVRFWAKRSKTVNDVVMQADDQRVGALAKMFTRHAYAEEEAFTRARVLYFTQIGHYTLDVPESMKVRFTHVESYVLTFCGRPLPKGEMDAFRRFGRRFHPDI
jgi:AcrR family transcriptional regulator